MHVGLSHHCWANRKPCSVPHTGTCAKAFTAPLSAIIENLKQSQRLSVGEAHKHDKSRDNTCLTLRCHTLSAECGAWHIVGAQETFVKRGKEGESEGSKAFQRVLQDPRKQTLLPPAGWERHTLEAVIVHFKNFHQMTSGFNSLLNVSLFSFSSSSVFLILVVEFPFAVVD